MSGERVLVTGGSGFLGAHCIVHLVRAGYRVRTTLRSSTGVERLHAMLHEGGISTPDAVEVVFADLTGDSGWASAVEGMDFVLHTASPYPSSAPAHEDELIVPARDGSLRVLRAARDARVKRVVLTSSFAAIGYGRARFDHTLTEADWTDPDAPGLAAYQRSKTIAERAAWKFIETDGGGLELAVVNPVGIIGPLLSSQPSTSMLLMGQLLNRELPALPRLSYGLVDVRDVADLHLLAMTHPAAAGERFLATAGNSLWVAEVARILHDNLGEAGRRVPTRAMPDWFVRLIALVNPSVRPMVHELGVFKPMSNEKSRTVLGWEPRTLTESLIATGESLVEHGIVKTR